MEGRTPVRPGFKCDRRERSLHILSTFRHLEPVETAMRSSAFYNIGKETSGNWKFKSRLRALTSSFRFLTSYFSYSRFTKLAIRSIAISI
jgi:hypothetical protein